MSEVPDSVEEILRRVEAARDQSDKDAQQALSAAVDRWVELGRPGAPDFQPPLPHATQKHLWEYQHPYYCHEINAVRYGSWADFAACESYNDPELNLVFRWDWRPKSGGWDSPEWHEDPNYRDGELYVFWVTQRKGKLRTSIVDVCFADEPEIRAFLCDRMDHIMVLWDGL